LLLFLYIAVGFFSGSAVAGWTSTMLVVVLLGAFQMFVLGMIGEYLGRLYVESKRRPLYLVADVVGPIQGRATLGYRAEAQPQPVRPELVEGQRSPQEPDLAESSASTGSARTEG
jgi:polyisoprenyl-phosphate glycosyltransferase